MEELNLTTPSLLFSATSLILLAYTNRFLSYAQVVRTLKEKVTHHSDELIEAQIKNLRQRLSLIRYMQILGISSLFFCVLSMFFIYINWRLFAAHIFGAGLVLLIVSLGICIREIQISIKALDIYLQGMENHTSKALQKDKKKQL